MKIISFAWTTSALLAGAKTVTRREWSDDYARRFHDGELVAAYNRSAKFGGHQVAAIRLTHEPYQERLSEADEAEYAAEGLAWMTEHGLEIREAIRRTPRQFWLDWKAENPLLWVVRFQLAEV